MKKTLELTNQELQIILFALQKIAWEAANPVIISINDQLQPKLVVDEQPK